MHNHILIATDGSKVSSAALVFGLDLAQELKAHVTVVTVTEIWSFFDIVKDDEMLINNPIKEYEAMCSRSANLILNNATEHAREVGVKVKTVHIPDRKPAEAIVEEAQARNCDLIIVGSHGRSGIENFLLGSQAAKIIALSKVPVLVYK
jgi:nucleotide-binding universal stress UspA family protein